VQPYFIDRIEDAAGQVVWHAAPRVVCDECQTTPRSLSDVSLSGSPAEALGNADAVRGGLGPLPPEQLAHASSAPRTPTS